MMKESQLHRAVAAYLALALPADCWWTTFPAGGGGRIRGAQLKAMGLAPGVPDILIIRGDGLLSYVFWIELKRPRGGSLSVAQKLCHAVLQQFGCYVATCRSVDEVRETLLGWGITPKARTA